jgi:ComF family protein
VDGSFSTTTVYALKPDDEQPSLPFEIPFKDLLADLVCPSCLSSFTPVNSPLCKNCGIVFQSHAADGHQCEACIKAPKRFFKARAFGIYDQSLMALIHGFKYRGKIQLAYPFSIMLLLTFLRYWRQGEVDIIIPVPLHKKRFRKRGFNQAYLLMKAWEKFQGEFYQLPRLERDILIRQRWTAPQTGLGRKERIRNIKNAFGVENPDQIRGKRVLLMDDVYTTGATVNECAKTLLSSGTERVDVLTLARAI